MNHVQLTDWTTQKVGLQRTLPKSLALMKDGHSIIQDMFTKNVGYSQ